MSLSDQEIGRQRLRCSAPKHDLRAAMDVAGALSGYQPHFRVYDAAQRESIRGDARHRGTQRENRDDKPHSVDSENILHGSRTTVACCCVSAARLIPVVS